MTINQQLLLQRIQACNLCITLVSTSNHMFGRAIWNKLREKFLKILELPESDKHNSKIFKNFKGDLSQKIVPTKHEVTG